MKIGLFTDAYLPEISGVSMAVSWFRSELESRGHETIVYAPRYKDQDESEPRTIRFRAGPVFGYRTARMALPYSREAFRSFETLDIVHSHTPFSLAYAAMIASARHHLPHVQTYHTYLSQYRHYVPRPIRPSVRAAESYSALLCNRCTTITAPTSPIADELRRFGVRQPVHVVPLGPHLPLYEHPPVWTPRAQLQIEPSATVLLYAGRLASEKNLQFLLRSFALAAEELSNTVLVFAGDGPLRSVLERQAGELGIEHAVRFAGFLDHPRLVDLYRTADLFVFASKTETQGLVLVEAMAADTPAIALGELGVLDVVQHGENGLLVEEDESEYAAALVGVLTDPALYSRLREGARRTTKRMSVQAYTDALVEIYTDCLNEPAHRPRRLGRLRRRRLRR